MLITLKVSPQNMLGSVVACRQSTDSRLRGTPAQAEMAIRLPHGLLVTSLVATHPEICSITVLSPVALPAEMVAWIKKRTIA